MPREATIGPIVYEEVNKLLAEGLKKSEAFHIVAGEMLDENASDEEVEKKARSVATTFYRLQRLAAENGGEPPAPKRRGRPPKVVTEGAAETVAPPAEAPKRRGRPPGSKNKPKDVVATPVAVHDSNGYEPDVMSALGQAKAAIDQAITRAREDARELAELRERASKLAQILG